MKPFQFCLLGIGLALLAACGRKPEALPPPNILWINCEDISPNLGAYGDPFAHTPNLDRLAAAGARFTNAFTTAPICAPARSCLITGLYATSLGTQHLRSEVPKPDSIRTLPDYLKEGGYFVTNYAKTDYNFNPEGIFDYWKQDLAPWRQRPRDDQPFFSYFVLGMTHEGGCNSTASWEKSTHDLPGELFHDPAATPVPVYYPDTAPLRTCWAHYYDNITVMDRLVGQILDSLETDGLKDNTIIFFFSDHGAGMPRYKRWLYRTGLQVPFLVYVPDQYRSLLPGQPGDADDRLVSFVDFAPTVLHLAGLPVPATMEGRPFLGENLPAPRSFIFGARSRADNMYDMARCVSDGRYLYIRHYQPHLPYIQPGIIFSDGKESLAELNRLHAAGKLPAAAEAMYQPRPVEEFYDWQTDPAELNNLAGQPQYREKMDSLRAIMHAWMRDYHDTGLLPEAEYMFRSRGSTPYEMAHNPQSFDAARLLAAAERVGLSNPDTLVRHLADADSGVRYWSVIGLQALGAEAAPAAGALQPLLSDPSPAVQIAAAETLCRLGACPDALPVLAKWVADDDVWIALYAARAIELLEDKAAPLVPVMQQVLAKYAAEPGSNIRYKDYNFAAFISWSLEYALRNCGQTLDQQEGLF